ncbi:MAG: hypothetical protein R3C26_00560 [Calditrichia bacterium]
MNTTDNADISGKQSAQQAFETHQNQKNNQQSFLKCAVYGQFPAGIDTISPHNLTGIAKSSGFFTQP